jgi:hypothetical protein
MVAYFVDIGEWWKIEARIEFQVEFWCSTDLRLIFSRSWHEGCAFSHTLNDSSDCCREVDSCSGVCLMHIPMSFSWFWILFLSLCTLLAFSDIYESKELCNQQFKTATKSQCFCIQFTQKLFHWGQYLFSRFTTFTTISNSKRSLLFTFSNS